MAERENSVLFSLKELRNIEEDRVKQEEADARAKIEAERRAKEEAIRAAKAEEERKIREEQERIARQEMEKERQIREERLRLEEAERRAKVEAAAKLEEARIQAEIHAKAVEKKAPIGAIVGAIIGVVVIAGGVLAYVIHAKNVEAEQREAAAKAEFDRTLKKALQDARDSLASEYDAKIAATKDEAEKARLKAEMKARQAAAEDAVKAKARASRPTAGTEKKKEAGLKKPNCDPTDPLCGSGL